MLVTDDDHDSLIGGMGVLMSTQLALLQTATTSAAGAEKHHADHQSDNIT
jgi:hypothetical protein